MHRFVYGIPTYVVRRTRASSTVAGLPIDGKAFVKGSTDHPLSEETIHQSWSRVVSKHGDRPALVSRSEWVGKDWLRWTFAEMDKAVDRAARGLESIGVTKGDRVAVYLGNTSQHATLQFATARIGAVLVSVNPSYRMHELLGVLNLVECKALVLCPRLKSTNNLSALLSALPSLHSAKAHDIRDETVPSLRSVILVDNSTDPASFFETVAKSSGITTYQEMMYMGSRPVGTYDVSNIEITNLQFTSGTTGKPKAVSLSHRNLVNNGIQIGDCMNLTEKDRLVNTPPLFHCFGLVLGNLAAWSHGSAIIYPNDTFDPTKTLAAVVEEKATAVHGVPTMFLAMFEELAKAKEGRLLSGLPDLFDFSSLRTGIAAGSSVPATLMSKLVDQLNLTELTIAYGMTESSPVSFQTKPNDALHKRCETIGTILPHVQAMICSPKVPFQALAIDQPGELYVSGYNVMHGYWNDPVETEKVVKIDERGQKWLATGDLVSIDSEGFATVRGRIKDVIIKGGENLFPIVIESHCLKHTGIGDASAIAVPDKLYGETVGIFIQRAANLAGKRLQAQDVYQHVKNFSRQSAPHFVWFLGEGQAPSEFPKTTSGKIQKMVLRQHAKGLAASREGYVRKVIKASVGEVDSTAL